MYLWYVGGVIDLAMFFLDVQVMRCSVDNKLYLFTVYKVLRFKGLVSHVY